MRTVVWAAGGVIWGFVLSGTNNVGASVMIALEIRLANRFNKSRLTRFATVRNIGTAAETLGKGRYVNRAGEQAEYHREGNHPGPNAASQCIHASHD